MRPKRVLRGIVLLLVVLVCWHASTFAADLASDTAAGQAIVTEAAAIVDTEVSLLHSDVTGTDHPIIGPFWPGQTRQAAPTADPGQRVTVGSDALARQAMTLIGWPRCLRYSFLATWSSDRLSHLVRWLELGFRIDGSWRSEELCLVIDVLDRYGVTYGESRFAEIVSAAVASGTDGKGEQLWLVRTKGEATSVAALYPTAGEIRINGMFFDDDTLAAQYHWGFLTGPYVYAYGEIDLRRVVVAHEFGHVVALGLQAEAEAAGHHRASIEHIYSHFVSALLRPHGYGSTQENLATEIAVWALGIGRPPEVRIFRNAFLNRTVESAAWAETAIPLLVHASASNAR